MYCVSSDAQFGRTLIAFALPIQREKDTLTCRKRNLEEIVCESHFEELKLKLKWRSAIKCFFWS